MTGRDILLRLLSVILLIALNAFFVTAEFSIVSVRRSRISQLVEAGDVQAKTVQSLQRSIDRLLSTTQLGITLSSLALGWIGESVMAVLMAKAIANLPLPEAISGALARSLSIPLAFILIAYLQIVLGELCPKSVALLYPEQLARFLGPSSLAIARSFKPFIWVLNQSTRALLRLVGIQYTGQRWHNRVTPEELQLIIATEGESTGLEAEQRQLLKNVFEFGDVLVSKVMVPRTNLVAIPSASTFKTLLEEVATTGHSRYPIAGDSLDDIRGIIDFKDLALPLARGQIQTQTLIHPWVKPIRFVPESTLLSELLPLMQRSRLRMTIVVDEFGGTAGLVTLQDLIDEIIGDERERSDSEQFDFQTLDEQTFLVEARASIKKVNELFGLELPVTDEYQTLGGFMLYQFQKIPNPGEAIYYQNLELSVVSTEGHRLYQIRIHQRQTTPQPSDNSNHPRVDETNSSITDGEEFKR